MISYAFLLLTILVSVFAASPPYVPTDVLLFNCGDTSNKTDNTGRKWTVETFQTNSLDASFFSDATIQESGVPLVPYMKARVFRSSFTYSFKVTTSGPKFVRLYFYPTRYGSFDAGTSLFTVTSNGFTLLRNFSADLTVKALEEFTVIKEFIIPVDGTMLNITFVPSPNSLAFVNGIEIVSMPDGFYSKGGFDDVISKVGSSIAFEIANWTAFETVHRLNVAGQTLSSDTGMFRRWVSDDMFLLGNSGTIPNVADVKINYTVKTPAYVAPDDVYATCRGMGNANNTEINLSFNLTWLFRVDPEFNYLVRLHFCEILPEVNKWGQRVFSIFINKMMAKREMDVFMLSGGNSVPMYLDFNVYVGSGSDLRLDLHPFTETNARYRDAILNGVEILKMSGSDGNLAGPNPNPETNTTTNSLSPGGQKGKTNVLVIILAVVGSSMFVIVVVLFLLMKKKKKSKEFSVHTTSKPTYSWTHVQTGSTNNGSGTSSLPSNLCRQFSLLEIKSATNDFEEKLIIGEGGFGSVYKGRIDGGTTLVAVKRLGVTSNQGVKEFETELEMLSMLRHIHLVSLIGYCDEENEMVLVYEYMPRGTLKDHLYKRDKFDPPLTWKQRLEICIGAARGLQYLHTGAKDTIIHRDIKTTNILLDENYVAKVSDFGLSKVGPTSASQTHVSTVVKGTFGYLDPEYYRRQVLTDKSDVYSFGVVLFEVLCCRPVKMENVKPEQAHLVRWVKSNYKKGTVDKVVDTDLTGDITKISLEKFCEIAVRCVEDRGTERPSMNDVVWSLEFALQLHETSKEKKSGVGSMDLLRGEAGTTSTDGEDELFSRTTGGHVSTTDGSNERSGSSWGVFSEIKEPKAR